MNAELCFDLGTNNERRGRVVKRLRGLDGEPIGRSPPNPLFDTREYEIEFTDGSKEKYQANVIAENMFAQVDYEGHQYLLLQEITDHRKLGSTYFRWICSISKWDAEAEGHNPRMGVVGPMERRFS